MESGKKIWSTVVDYFLILSAIIGVGFASGKEIYVFFFAFDGASIIGLLAFGLLYIYLFLIVGYVKKKLELNSYSEFNSIIFGSLCKLTNVIMIINFTITSAGMLAGADYLFENFFGIGYRIPSIILTIITLFVLFGGIRKVKLIANIIVPLMIAVIVINSIGNINPQNVNMQINVQSGFMAVYYGILFGVNNFVAALPVLFETKLRSKGKLFVIFSICLIIFLNILVFASNHCSTDMPMFEVSANISVWFYYIYFVALICGLFSTLMICSYNTQNILIKDKKSIFVSIIIVLINFILSNLGYAFIVKYLYVVSGIISGIYLIVLVIMISVKLAKYKIKSKKIEKVKNHTENEDNK